MLRPTRQECNQGQTVLGSSVTGDVITRNTRSTRHELEMACSAPGGALVSVNVLRMQRDFRAASDDRRPE